MQQQIIDRFLAEFGPMKNPTDKLGRWEARLDFGIAVERENGKTCGVAHVWTPHPGPNVALPANAEEYSPTEGRHSNTYALSGMRRHMAALRHRVESPAQADALVSFIRALPPIRSVA